MDNEIQAENQVKGKKIQIPKEVFERMKKIKQYKRLLIVALIIIIFLIVFVNVFNQKSLGNTIGNIRNYGYATKSGDWIYFLSPGSDSTEFGIYKIKDGDIEQKTKTEIVKDSWSITSLNVFEDYLYFIAVLSEEYQEDDRVDNKIYKIKTDGTELTVINDNEFSNDCYEIYVANGILYYIGTDYNIYKMDLDGRNRVLVSDNGTGYLGITDKYILYNVVNETNNDYITYIMDLDGKNARPIIENTRLYSVNLVENYIYYTDTNKNICRVKIDGTNQQVLYETTAFNLNVSGKYIYYLNYADKSNSDYTVCVFKVKTDGSTKEPELVKELDTYSAFLDVVGDWVIYLDYNDVEGFIKLVKTDGTEEIKVYSINFVEYYETEYSEDTTTP